MNPKLSQSEDVLIDKFKSLKTRQDVSELLEVGDNTLIYYLFRNKVARYREFSINKKSGGKRLINTPVTGLKILQQKLNHILYLVYKPKNSAHGFVQGRNIYTNAQKHVNKKFVINIDIEDFFPSINFGRVRGMFMAGPYKITPEAATVLAQLCCHNNALPQGAPTSPVISNMISARLDNELSLLATRCGCVYTRFADDITFSTNRSILDKKIVNLVDVDSKIHLLPGDELVRIISMNGFKINSKKFRVQHKSRHQQVTGLTVNRKVNIRKRFIKRIRSMLHAWMTHNPVRASNEYFLKYNDKERLNNAVDFKEIVRGKIEFLRSIKSSQDRMYRVFVNNYNDLMANGKPKLPLNAFEEIIPSIWVVESGGKTGTAFMMEGYGLVTCDHCVPDKNNIEVYRFNEYSRMSRWKAKCLSYSSEKDLAILKVEGMDVLPKLKPSFASLAVGDYINTVGFPHYSIGCPPLPHDGKVRGLVPYGSVLRVVVTQHLQSGESGGPSLNSKGEVVGVIVWGSDNPETAHFAATYAIIPITEINSTGDSSWVHV